MLDAARHALERLQDSVDGYPAPLRQVEAQLEKMAAEVARIEGVIEGKAVGVRN